MTTVTVCVPAYRSGPAIATTLRSLQRQSHRDLAVRIAIDPPAEETERHLSPFLTDRRIEVSVNRERLGWDANIHALIARVETPAFLVLPQDDCLHRQAISVLLAELERTPAASVAYGDMLICGAGPSQRKFLELPQRGSREEQVLAFFLGGAEAVAWRGVTRTAILEKIGGFPVDGFRGFAVESEWALELLLAGRAVRVPRRLYFKRVQPRNRHSASRERIDLSSRADRRRAWGRHRSVMLGALQRSLPPISESAKLVTLAAELAMLRRLAMARLPLTLSDRAQARRLAAEAEALAAVAAVRSGAAHPDATRVAEEFRRLASRSRLLAETTLSLRLLANAVRRVMARRGWFPGLRLNP